MCKRRKRHLQNAFSVSQVTTDVVETKIQNFKLKLVAVTNDSSFARSVMLCRMRMTRDDRSTTKVRVACSLNWTAKRQFRRGIYCIVCRFDYRTAYCPVFVVKTVSKMSNGKLSHRQLLQSIVRHYR